MRYHSLNRYLRTRYGGRIGKICIDGGFSCPNRDGTCGTGGCIFCGERGAGEHIASGIGIGLCVQDFLSSQNQHKTADGYIAYFQNFTNTYAPVSVLRERYEQALIDPRIVALAVGTRPDCISEPVAQLLADIQNRYRGLSFPTAITNPPFGGSLKSEPELEPESRLATAEAPCDTAVFSNSFSDLFQVWAELGLQTASDATAEILNRGYKTAEFTRAAEILNRWNIPIVVHLIIGLPGESFDDLKRTVEFVNRHRIWGIKIHSLYVSEGTELAKLYRLGAFQPISQNEYVTQAVYALTHISPELVVHRLSGDCPLNRLVAPSWIPQKNQTIELINQSLELASWEQGTFYSDIKD